MTRRWRLDVALERLPGCLADAHRTLPVGARLALTLPRGDAPRRATVADVLVGAGFDDVAVEVGNGRLAVTARRARSLADTVAPAMRLLVCGLNPSLYAADAGVAFARPGNRFWPAAVEAGLVSRPRDPVHALTQHGIGMTDLVKRATPRAAELTAAEYRAGLARLERLAAWLRPGAVCFVGLTGWRTATGSATPAGVQVRRLAGVPVYAMPSTSGANAHARPAELAAHLRAAAALASRTCGVKPGGFTPR